MSILQPVVALAIWTMVIWVWMYATRIPAMNAAKVDPDQLANDPDVSLETLLPPKVQWKSHNYNHLHEAPTVFYAVCLVLALLERGDGATLSLAWIYVALRVAHSLVQVTVNKVIVRFLIFAASSVILAALIGVAATAVFLG